MKIVLKHDIDNLGKKGDVLEVKDGYARNSLLPQGLVEVATDSTLKLTEKLKKQRAEEEAARIAELEKVFEGIKGMKIEIYAKTKEDDTLFGSVKAEDIMKALNKKSKAEFSKDMIRLQEPIKAIGEYKVTVKISKDLETEIELKISKEK